MSSSAAEGVSKRYLYGGVSVVLAFFVTLGSFLIVVGGLHCLLFTKWKPKSDRFWKATDYVWLFVAVLGLWGTIARQEKDYKARQINDLEQSLEREYAAQQVWIGRLASNASFVAAMKMENQPNKDVVLRPDVLAYLMTSQQAARVQLALANKRPYHKHAVELDNLIAELRADGRAEVKNIGDEADLMRRRASADEERLDTVQAEATSPTVAWTLKWVSPVLLALAIAIRFTRVTAEIYVLKKGEPWSAILQGNARP